MTVPVVAMINYLLGHFLLIILYIFVSLQSWYSLNSPQEVDKLYTFSVISSMSIHSVSRQNHLLSSDQVDRVLGLEHKRSHVRAQSTATVLMIISHN